MALTIPGAGLGLYVLKPSKKSLFYIDGASYFVPETTNALDSVDSSEQYSFQIKSWPICSY